MNLTLLIMFGFWPGASAAVVVTASVGPLCIEAVQVIASMADHVQVISSIAEQVQVNCGS